MLADEGAHRVVVPVEHQPPGVVTGGGDLRRRSDDVREEHGGEEAISVRFAFLAGDEGTDLVEDLGGVAEKQDVVLAVDLDEAGAGNMGRQVAAVLDADVAVVPPVHDQGRHPQCPQNATKVPSSDVEPVRADGRGCGGKPLAPCPPRDDAGVVGNARGEQLSRLAGAPAQPRTSNSTSRPKDASRCKNSRA
jgi:hypothetical protein